MSKSRAVLFLQLAATAGALGCGVGQSELEAREGGSDLPLPALDAGSASPEDAGFTPLPDAGGAEDGGLEDGSCSFTVAGGAVPGSYSVLPAALDDGYSWTFAEECATSQSGADCATSKAEGNVSIQFECDTLVEGNTYNIVFLTAGTRGAAAYPAWGELYTGPIGVWTGPRYFSAGSSCTAQALVDPDATQRLHATFQCEALARDAPDDAGDAPASLWGSIDVPLNPWQPAPK